MVDDGSDGTYTQGNGPVFVIAGMPGGGGFTSLNCADSERDYFAKAMGGNGQIWNGTSCQSMGVGRGITKFTVSPDRIDMQFVMCYQTVSGTPFTDGFSIVRSGSSTTPPPSNSHADLASYLANTHTTITCPTLLTNGGSVTLTASSITAGTYAIWSRMMAANDSANSYYLQVDNNCPMSVGNSVGMPTNSWEWVNYQDGNTLKKVILSLSSGSHTFKLIMKEPRVKVDEILLTSNVLCTPIGFGENCSSIQATSTPTPTIVTTPTTPTASPSITPVSTPSTGALEFIPLDDSFVRAGSPSSNYGSRESLQVDGDPLKIIYMKFDLTSLAGKAINSAKLRITITDSSSDRQTIKFVNNTSWGERTITYSNRPIPAETIGSIGSGRSGGIVEVDLISFIRNQAGKIISVAIEQSGGNELDFGSKETSSGKPLLVVN